jgi:two-component system OmpR family response regulator
LKAKEKILLVEDDANFGLVLRDYLKLNNYDVDLAETGAIAYSLLRKNDYTLCILDVMMPEMDGFTLAEKMLHLNLQLPIIFLTAKSLKEDMVKGYKLGALDYLNKPFDPEILLLKLKAIINRKQPKSLTVSKHPYQFKGYVLQPNIRQLSYPNGQDKTLSPKENQVLVQLLENQNTLIKRDFILSTIWEETNYFTSRSLDVYINKLRKRFSNSPEITIQNIRGEGFIFKI